VNAEVERSDTPDRPTRRNWIFPIVVLVAVAVLTIVALARDPVTLDPDTPEGTVQAYLQALADNDFESALALTDSVIRQSCTALDIENNFYYDSFTATLGGVKDFGSTMVVEVAINQSESGFDSGYFEQIEVIEEDGKWAVHGDPWPFFTYSCVNG
jgi:hypothetical protein